MSSSPTNRWTAFIKAAVITALLLILFRHNLLRLWNRTNPLTGDPNWGHAPFVPLIGLLYLHLHRADLRAARIKPAATGLLALLAGIGLFLLAIWPGQNEFLQDVGMVLALFGVVLTWFGWSVMRVAWFPIAFLLCAIPWPETFYNWVASPLQRLAAGAAVNTLSVLGVDARQLGTKIYLYGAAGQVRVLNVAEACSGLRALGTFITMGAMVAFLTRRPVWQKIAIMLWTVPIAVACNVARVTGQGLLDYYVSPRLSEGAYHQSIGFAMIVAGFVLIAAVAWLLDHLFIGGSSPEGQSGDRVKGAMSHACAGMSSDPPGAWPRGSGAAVPNRVGGVAMAPILRSSFVLMVGVLLISTAGLGAATRMLKITFAKLPVPLTKPLDTLPARLASWQQIGADQELSADLLETLGTRQYVMRSYVDTRLVDPPTLAQLQQGSDTDRQAQLSRLRAACPQAVVNLAVTYYTGTVEKLSHMPEVCYVADGYRPSRSDIARWAIGDRQIELRFLQFEDQSAATRATCNVAYLFHVNGQYKSDPWAVRYQLQSPFVKHNYFSKVEMMVSLADRAQCAAVMQDFLSSALGEIERCLPDWQKVSRDEGR